jgi:prepilin-type N-terminal cleavage/methylation domain-containing protein
MMRKAFTLLELLVVVGIMGMLGVAATAGYSALVRGMTERGAVAAATGLLRAARERAQVDRVPTAVFCYNRLLRAATQDDNAVVVGVMTAVRRSGRLTYVKGTFLFDEFADLDRTYESSGNANELRNGSGFRLYKLNGKPSDMQYSIVADRVLSDPQAEMAILFGGSDGATLDGEEIVKNSYAELQSGAFVNLGKSQSEPGGWSVGDGYAFEFAEIQLPEGFIFGRKVPSTVGKDTFVEAFYFSPTTGDSNESIDIYWTRPNASGLPQPDEKAGEATAKSDTEV